MKKILLGLTTLIFLFFVSCKKNNTQPDPKPVEKIKLGEAATSKNEKLTLWSDEVLATGYHKLYLSVLDREGKVVNNANVSFLPMMDMGTMKHSSPVEQPVYNDATELYEGSAVFTMPSGTHTWMIHIRVNGEEKIMNVSIPDAKTKLTGSYAGTDGNKYVLSLVPGKNWEVGLNDLQILINKNDVISFPVVDDLKIYMEPEMPSMGHGSPNNTDPVSIGNGRYKGKVNFTMTGDWRLHFKVTRNGVVIIENATIDLLF